MSEYAVIGKIMESDRITEKDKVYFIKMFLTGWSEEEDLRWIWED